MNAPAKMLVVVGIALIALAGLYFLVRPEAPPESPLVIFEQERGGEQANATERPQTARSEQDRSPRDRRSDAAARRNDDQSVSPRIEDLDSFGSRADGVEPGRELRPDLDEPVIPLGVRPLADDGHAEDFSRFRGPWPLMTIQEQREGGKGDIEIVWREAVEEEIPVSLDDLNSLEETLRTAGARESAAQDSGVQPRSIPGTDTSRAAPPSAPAAERGETYVVKSGDTLSAIAAWWFGDGRYWSLIEQANSGVDPARLQVGQRLTLPPKSVVAESRRPVSAPSALRDPRGTVYIVKPGDTLSSIARAMYGDVAKWRSIFDANRAVIGSSPDSLEVGMRLILPRETRGG